MTNRTAAEAYQAQRAKIAEKMVEIAKGLELHAQRQADDARNWGYAGDLAHVNELLSQVLESLPKA
jgi:hypothetical protein